MGPHPGPCESQHHRVRPRLTPVPTLVDDPTMAGRVDLPKFDEPGYILQPPCLWGDAPGLAPIVVRGVNKHPHHVRHVLRAKIGQATRLSKREPRRYLLCATPLLHKARSTARLRKGKMV